MIVDATPLWSQSPGHRLRGLCLAREKGWLFGWDRTHWLYVLDQAGELQARLHCEEPITTAAICEDGSMAAAVTSQGRLQALNPDLSPRWQRDLGIAPLAIALEPFGKFTAVSDVKGNVHFLDANGQLVGQFPSPRPLHHLAFVPEATLLIGCADYGLVGAFDLAGKLLWRDAPVMNTGSLSVTGSASATVLASFSEGLQIYGPKGEKLRQCPLPEPCPLAAVTYTGDLLVAVGLGGTLYFLDASGRLISQVAGAKPIQSMAVDAFGRNMYVLSKEGELVRWKLST